MGYYAQQVTPVNKAPETENYIHISIPLFIRLLELAKELVDVDRDLHVITEAVIRVSSDKPATMKDYDGIIQALLKQDTADPTQQYEDLVMKRSTRK